MITVLSLDAESKMSLLGWLIGVAIAVTHPSWPSRVPRKVKVSAMVLFFLKGLSLSLYLTV